MVAENQEALFPGDGGGATKEELVRRYRNDFVGKLTPGDLEELQSLAARQVDADHHIVPEYRLRFELALRRFFPEEVMRREIATIEALIPMLGPEDLGAGTPDETP